jgi:hypothetical protein
VPCRGGGRRAVAEALHIDLEDLERMEVEGIASTWLEDSVGRSLVTEFEAALIAG